MSRLEKALEEALRRKKGEGEETRAENPGAGTSQSKSETGAAGRPPAAPSLSEPPPPLRPFSVNSPFVIANREDNPYIAEEFGKIKSQLMRMAVKNPSLHRMLVTSSIKEEGKSLTALNLALSLARSYDHNVLLIDADLRCPSVNRYLGIDLKPGLVQCLREGLPLFEAQVRIGLPNFSVLTAGDVVSDPVELLSSASTKKWFADLGDRKEDMFVIIDTPPVLLFADTHSLLPLVGGVIYVVREGRASKDQIEDALNSIGGCNLLGVIYNGAPRGKRQSSYYDAYSY